MQTILNNLNNSAARFSVCFTPAKRREMLQDGEGSDQNPILVHWSFHTTDKLVYLGWLEMRLLFKSATPGELPLTAGFCGAPFVCQEQSEIHSALRVKNLATACTGCTKSCQCLTTCASEVPVKSGGSISLKESSSCDILSAPSYRAAAGNTRAGILPGCPNPGRGSREAEVGIEPRTFQSRCELITPPTDVGRKGSCGPINSCARWPKWLEREFTDRKVRGSNPTSATRLPLSRLGQPASIPTVVLPSAGTAARHRKGATVERFLSFCAERKRDRLTRSTAVANFQIGLASIRPYSTAFVGYSTCIAHEFRLIVPFPDDLGEEADCYALRIVADISEMAQWLNREFTDRKFRGSNPNTVSRLPTGHGQPGSISTLMLPSGGMEARH
ncbi:hypothetical protein T265_09051 [Opisthorchis viverrini]|uniref:Uncharacterized protein n=1 Tax=Opisthorchis viverrini TaxID=6198 RepID=A0A074Z793_OPIVI|nr:hypothetical protein T265_09051 [Opisthorchis viverrini]KER22968.1 hypothetical protein T265_09051 [Opisthorchis viverrini]